MRRRSGADINVQNADGDTAAHLAASLRNLSLLTILLQAGCCLYCPSDYVEDSLCHCWIHD